jgi:putative ABC transport system permease protein
VSCGAEEPTNIAWDDEISTTADQSVPFVFVYASPTDIDFVKTLGVHIVSGSDFTLADWKKMDTTNGFANWQTSYMLNESAVKAMGWTPGQAIGKTIYRSGQKGTIKAVLQDFHFAPLHESIRPLVIFLDSNYFHIYQMFAKVSGNNLPAAIQALGENWKQRVSHRPFQYHFLDDNYNRNYHNEQQTAKIFSTFSAVAIILACLGLFALAAYSTIQRAKEIGIRKVLGANVKDIVMLISGDFIRLVIIASLIASPIAWYFAKNWLEQFAYRIDIQWWVFVVAGLSAALVGIGSMSFQAFRAAVANPAKSLQAD